MPHISADVGLDTKAEPLHSISPLISPKLEEFPNEFPICCFEYEKVEPSFNMTYVNKSSVIGISVFFPLFGLIAICGRYYARFLRKQPLGIDDILCIPAWVSQEELALIFRCGHDLIFGAGAPSNMRGVNDIRYVVLHRSISDEGECTRSLNALQGATVGAVGGHSAEGSEPPQGIQAEKVRSSAIRLRSFGLKQN